MAEPDFQGNLIKIRDFFFFLNNDLFTLVLL